MNRAWASFQAHPYISNVLGYTALFASADLIQQRVLGRNPAPASERSAGIDWHQTARVATVGLCFHANFNYHWLRGLERMVPGGGLRAVTRKVVLDQLVAAPVTISAFYIGLSFLENRDDLLEDWRQKFWTSYKVLNLMFSFTGLRDNRAAALKYLSVTAGRSGVLVNDAGQMLCFH
uniref:Si:ch211-120k19.1 n=1 Tax=Poecilia formosa TaxID=48698 RepID=A0A096M1M7_POEFO